MGASRTGTPSPFPRLPRLNFDRRLMLQFRGSAITSDGCPIANWTGAPLHITELVEHGQRVIAGATEMSSTITLAVASGHFANLPTG